MFDYNYAISDNDRAKVLGELDGGWGDKAHIDLVHLVDVMWNAVLTVQGGDSE